MDKIKTVKCSLTQATATDRFCLRSGNIMANYDLGLLFLSGLALAGCASANVIDLDANTVQVSAGAAPACGAKGAQQFAVKTAAYETLKRGFDRYVIVGAQASSSDRVAGYTPLQAQTYSNGRLNTYGNTGYYSGTANTTITGGQPIVVTDHGQDLVVRMFREGDPGSENAIDAKTALGPEWQKVMQKGPGNTCT
jgi:hypothetical protein